MIALQEKSNIPRWKASEVVSIFFNEMTNALAKGERVEIRGLCSFYVKEYPGYIGRNPKTSEKVQIAGKRLPVFKCGKELKKRVDYKKGK
ncbi:HU family DNA-binding protein [Desulfamplus magnetovallimortis]|uniref:HU family DNA-binding protein n=1 Tax=Desulfamplus magnetovallimortis TaxID=1246637 RepID=UPI0009B98631|nr:HU family DNA-binding protein [Desulfamplus magnetovallimortis]